MLPEIAYSLADTKEGCKTLLVIHENREFPLHSRFYPTHEQELYREKFDPEKYDFLVVLGTGLGYHLLSLKEKITRYSGIVLIDVLDGIQDEIARNEFTSFLASSGNVEFLTAQMPDRVEQRLTNAIDMNDIRGITVVEHESSVRIFSEYYSEIKKIIEKIINKKAQNRATQSAFSLRYVKNIVKNLKALNDAIPVKKLFGRFEQYPCVIIVPGPSLDRSIDVLGKNAGKYFIISVDSALPVLAGNGIEPDFLVSIDPQPFVYEHTTGIATDAVRVFSLSSYSEPSCFRYSAVSLNTHPLSQIVSSLTRDGIGSIDSSTGTVAGDAISMGVKLGFRAIGLLGFDFSFLDHVIYARGSAYQRRFATLFQNRYHPAESQNIHYIRKSSRGFMHSGRHTRRAFIQYKDSIEGIIDKYKIQNKNINIYNINARGLAIQGVNETPLNLFIKNECGSHIEKNDLIRGIITKSEKAEGIIPLKECKKILLDPNVFHEAITSSFGKEPDERIMIKISRLIDNLF